jgi:predicted TIM-barrel fold metal-dependent hydrolase
LNKEQGAKHMIIDCHVHVASKLTGFWKPLRYGKTEDRGEVRQALPPAFDPPASPPEILLGYMDQAGVDCAVMVQHHLYGDQNATVIDALKRWPDRFVGFAYLGGVGQPDAPDQLERLIDAGLAGLKIELEMTRRLRADFCFDGEREWRVWERLEKLQRPLILDLNAAKPEDTVALRKVIATFPHMRVAICHLGGAPRPGWEERALLAKNPHVWVDIASLQSAYGPDQEYPFPQSQELIRWAVDNLGAQKMMWGTDYPGVLNWGTYRQMVDVVRRHCEFLTPEQKQELLSGAAQRFLKG